MDKLLIWLRNAKTFHHRLMMWHLRKHGWVVFYLEEPHRKHGDTCDICFWQLYENELKR